MADEGAVLHVRMSALLLPVFPSQRVLLSLENACPLSRYKDMQEADMIAWSAYIARLVSRHYNNMIHDRCTT